jgi:site-specific DNA-methyltransferase (adenine-specific)
MIVTGDCREIMPEHGPFDMIIADPPYGDTSLSWDRPIEGWLDVAHASLKPTGSIWVFGSLRSLLASASAFPTAGLRMAQDVVWEKNAGSSFAADRFKRVHEHVVQFYRTDALWRGVYNDVQTTPTSRAVHVRKIVRSISHTGGIGVGPDYIREEGGPQLMRSVIYVPNMQGRAIHPTEKPVPLLEILIRTSCPPDGLVGDFFAGSGAGGEAAIACGRRYVGCEIDPEMAQKARARLAGILPFGG